MVDLSSALHIRHIRFVVAAAEFGSFRRAAIHLNVPESAISRRISDLEAWLGTKIFIRSTAGVRLTFAGEKFVLRCHHLLSEVNLAQSEIHSVRQGMSGMLTIGVNCSLASSTLSALLRDFAEKHPKIYTTYIEATAEAHLFQAGSLTLDIAFVSDEGVPQKFSSQCLWQERLFAVLPEAHPRARESNLNIGALAEDTFLLNDSARGRIISQYLHRRLGALGFRPHIRYHDVDQDSLPLLVALGHGITIAFEPTTIGRMPGVVLRPIAEPRLIHAIWSEENDNPALPLFLKLAKSVKE